MIPAAPLLIAAALAAGGPDRRQALVDLAYVLGQAHALRQACAGAADQAWRTRMTRLIEIEAPGEAFKAQLVERFNAGFMTARAEHPACDAGVAGAEQAAGLQGRALAERLGGAAP